MAQGPMKSLLHCIRRTAGAARRTDQELLAAFLTRADEAAFRALLARHGPLVLGACRQVLRDEADVEDAFQATFLVLLKKGTTVRHHVALGGWLFRVARRVAKDARAAALARRRREARLALAPDAGTSSPDPSWREACAALHEELDRLPDKFRLPLVLCYLQGQSRDEAARQLGWSVGAVKGRLERGRLVLRNRLVRRGFALSAGLLAALENSPAAGSVLPPRLIDVTLRAAAGSGVVPASVAALVEGGLRMMFSKTKVMMALLFVAILAGAAGLGGRLTGAAPPPQAAEKPAAAPEGNAGEGVTVAGRVLDPDGKPTAGAHISWGQGERPADKAPQPPYARRAVTGADGRFRFTAPAADFVGERRERLQVVADAVGFGPGWVEGLTTADAGDLTLRLVKDDVPLRGRVFDLEGRPVPGAVVRVLGVQATSGEDLTPWLRAVKDKERVRDDDFFTKTLQHLERGVPGLPATVIADAEGRFRLTGAGRERAVLAFIGGRTIGTDLVMMLTRPGPKLPFPDHSDSQELLTAYGATFDHVATPPLPVAGTVRDADTGKPLAGTRVRLEMDDFGEVKTNAGGKYRFATLPGFTVRPGEPFRLLAVPPADQPYLPAVKTVRPGSPARPTAADFALRRGLWAEGRVTDKATGKPVRAGVKYYAYRDNPHLVGAADFPGASVFAVDLCATGADGRFRLAVLPGRGLLAVRGQDGEYLARGALSADEGSRVLLPDASYLGNFQALVRIDPAKEARSVTCDVVLDPGAAVAGTVLGPDGKPLAGVSVFGLKLRHAWTAKPLPTADFTLTAVGPHERRHLVFLHPEKKLGCHAEVAEDAKESATVRLKPTGAVVGRLLDADGRAKARTDLVMLFDRKDVDTNAYHFPAYTKTDAEGRFRVEGLVDGVVYHLYVADRPPNRTVGGRFKAESGKTKELGDVKVRPIGE